ncbi:sulfite exporter TauE/SafE family protein [Nocardia jejuensis]|uniref:sulfite exporter TauE/SafE family protein n=1 Tax=Nocardia jejuensis TaxID=328049 RepID=UPI000831419E|nr:sulfite exporter TauE/SafE family protein [Nocardia jejuensis]
MLTSVLVLLCFGSLSGLTTVLFGFGGGFVTVPVVFAVTGATAGPEAMHVAVATSTAVMIVNAAVATLTQLRAGHLRREYLFPLSLFIAIGAACGALAAVAAAPAVLTTLFIAYLAATIADCVVRRGFFLDRSGAATAAPEHPGTAISTLGGLGIGAIASFLGVGGSVMTVPMLRRRGLAMAEAAALANPLSLPVALVGTLVYAAAAPATTRPGHLGQIDLIAAAALLAGALPTIALTRRLAARIPDRAHAIGYLGFLTVVLIAMVVTQFVN